LDTIHNDGFLTRTAEPMPFIRDSSGCRSTDRLASQWLVIHELLSPLTSFAQHWALGTRIGNVGICADLPAPVYLLHLFSGTTVNFDISQTRPNSEVHVSLPCLHLEPQTMSSSAVHHIDLDADSSYAEEADLTYHAVEKGSTMTKTSDVKQEWRADSRKRVVGHFFAWMLIGILIGWFIGMGVNRWSCNPLSNRWAHAEFGERQLSRGVELC
jgi:hypothetical protein